MVAGLRLRRGPAVPTPDLPEPGPPPGPATPGPSFIDVSTLPTPVATVTAEATPEATPATTPGPAAAVTPTPDPSTPSTTTPSVPATSTPATSTPSTSTPPELLATTTPPMELTFTNVRAGTNIPSQVQIVFSLRDDEGHSVIFEDEELQATTRIYEMSTEDEGVDQAFAELEVPGLGPTAQGWEEIDYTETSFFVRTAKDFEIVFILDFTNSMARAVLPDGRTGIEAMLDAFERSLASLPIAHRIGVVEFHDRNAEPGILSELTTDRDAILDSVNIFNQSTFDPASSRVWDSIQTAANLFSSSRANLTVVRALVFISDGRDTSSVSSRADAGVTAETSDIQLYALGMVNVFEEDELAAMVRSMGGLYYPTRQVEDLEEQLGVLVNDLRGQYLVSYITLRRQGTYRTRVDIDLTDAVGTFESPELDVATFYGLDNQGRISVDPPSRDQEAGTARVFLRALHVPRNIDRFRFTLDTEKGVEVSLVSEEDGGLLEGWELTQDFQGFYVASNVRALEFGNFGILFQLDISGATENSLDIPLTFDNSFYTAGKSFNYPPFFCLGECPAGRITFRSNRNAVTSDIYVMNFDGTDQRNITNHINEDFYPDWSPDGLQIVFNSKREGNNREIFVMGDDGADPENITNNRLDDSLPSWSPDGSQIAFDSVRDGNREIYVMDADGENQTRLTTNGASDWWASWSPDGERIVFTSDRSGNPDIWVIDADGTGSTNLTDSPGGDFRPVWSPDGEQIVFYSLRDGDREIYIMNEDGTNQRNLTNDPSQDWYPDWSPDGLRIAFTTLRDGNREIYIMNEDGTSLRNVSNSPGDDWAPAWGPDR